MSTRRVCDGYLPDLANDAGKPTPSIKPISRRALAVAIRHINAVGPTARILSPSSYLENDSACFDFFRFRVTTVPLGHKDSAHSLGGFWNCTLLQASHAEPAVWHAVAALGALYRQWEILSSGSSGALLKLDAAMVHFQDGTDVQPRCNASNDSKFDVDSQSSRLASQANSCYARSLGLAKNIRDPRAILVLSLALAATANLSGKWIDSSIHIQAGQNILANITEEATRRPRTDVEVTSAESLAKLGLQWITRSDQSAPYPYEDAQSMEDDPATFFDYARQPAFQGMHEANFALVGILQRILSTAGVHDHHEGSRQKMGNDGPSPSRQTERAILRELRVWEHQTAGVLSSSPPNSLRRTLDYLSLKLLHAGTRLLIAGNVMSSTHSELNWDSCLPYFERVVALTALILRTEAQANPLLPPVMSLDEPAINLVLFITASRCRHPLIRRRALALLCGARRIEGLWMSTSTGAAVARIIELEEGSLTMSADVARAFRRKWNDIETDIIRTIELEVLDPWSWLGDSAPWMVATSSWDIPGDLVVPMSRRISQVDVSARYDPRVGKSTGELELTMAEREENGEQRKVKILINF